MRRLLSIFLRLTMLSFQYWIYLIPPGWLVRHIANPGSKGNILLDSKVISPLLEMSTADYPTFGIQKFLCKLIRIVRSLIRPVRWKYLKDMLFYNFRKKRFTKKTMIMRLGLLLWIVWFVLNFQLNITSSGLSAFANIWSLTITILNGGFNLDIGNNTLNL